MPKVTVITAYFNRGQLLERTVESILRQTFADLELIVIDDASTDDTAERLSDLDARYSDPRLKCVLHETNIGLVRSLREAIAGSTSDYIAIQGSGDESHLTRIERQVALLDQRPDVGLVGTWFETVNEATDTRSIRSLIADNVGVEELRRGNVFTHGEVMFRRDAYEAVGGYRAEFRYTQDYDLWLRLISITRFATVQEVLYTRYLLADGIALTPSKLIDQRRFQILARRLQSLSDADELAMLQRVQTDGIAGVIPNSDREFRRTHLRATIDMGINRSAAVARVMAREGIDGAFLSRALSIGFGIYDRPIARPVRIGVDLARQARRRIRVALREPKARRTDAAT